MGDNEYKKIFKDIPGFSVGISGTTPAELKVKSESVLLRLNERAKRLTERERLEHLKELAEYDTRQVRLFFEECRFILKNNFGKEDKLNWVSLYDDRPYPPFVFEEAPPRYKQVAKETGVPPRDTLRELLFPAVKKRRVNMEKEAEGIYAEKLRDYEESKESARSTHEVDRAAFLAGLKEYNQTVEQLQLDVERSVPGAVESFARIALIKLRYPETINVDFDAVYEPSDKLLVINCNLPGPLEIPGIVRYQYNKEQNGITAVAMDRDKYNDFYESTLLQIALSSVHIIFKSAPERTIGSVVFNGWVNTGETSTVGMTSICVLTCKIARDAFEAVDFINIPPKECFRRLNGSMREPLSKLTPVEPYAGIGRAVSTISNYEQSSTNAETPNKPEDYKPGDFKDLTRGLVSDMLGQIESEISKAINERKDNIH